MRVLYIDLDALTPSHLGVLRLRAGHVADHRRGREGRRRLQTATARTRRACRAGPRSTPGGSASRPASSATAGRRPSQRCSRSSIAAFATSSTSRAWPGSSEGRPAHGDDQPVRPAARRPLVLRRASTRSTTPARAGRRSPRTSSRASRSGSDEHAAERRLVPARQLLGHPHPLPRADDYGDRSKDEPLDWLVHGRRSSPGMQSKTGPHTAQDLGHVQGRGTRRSTRASPRPSSIGRRSRQWIDGYDTAIRYVDDHIEA